MGRLLSRFKASDFQTTDAHPLSVTVTDPVWERALWIGLSLHAYCHRGAGSPDCTPGQLHQETVPRLSSSVPRPTDQEVTCPRLHSLLRWSWDLNPNPSYLENKSTTKRKCLQLTRKILYNQLHTPILCLLSHCFLNLWPLRASAQAGPVLSHLHTMPSPLLLQPAMSPACPAEDPNQNPALWAECSQFTLFSWCRPHFPHLDKPSPVSSTRPPLQLEACIQLIEESYILSGCWFQKWALGLR